MTNRARIYAVSKGRNHASLWNRIYQLSLPSIIAGALYKMTKSPPLSLSYTGQPDVLIHLFLYFYITPIFAKSSYQFFSTTQAFSALIFFAYGLLLVKGRRQIKLRSSSELFFHRGYFSPQYASYGVSWNDAFRLYPHHLAFIFRTLIARSKELPCRSLYSLHRTVPKDYGHLLPIWEDRAKHILCFLCRAFPEHPCGMVYFVKIFCAWDEWSASFIGYLLYISP